ncbi:MAG: hemolysin family protein [Pirellulaceae bacterium]|nr:hemolysin family protein [Pirellulaceae bacterium]
MIMVLFWIVFGSVVIVVLTAIAARVLHDFSRHELEVYCRRRNRQDVFDDVLGSNDQCALGAEAIQWFANAVFILSCSLCFFSISGSIQGDGEVQRFEMPGVSQSILWSISLTFFLVLVNSWIPWAVVRFASAPYLYHTWGLWRFVRQLSWPFSIGYAMLTAFAQRIAGRKIDADDDEDALEEEIRTIVTAGERDGLLESDAREMIEGVMDLDEVEVGEIMTPRSRMNALDIDLPNWELIRQAIEFGNTRIPIYQKEVNNIIGLLFVKDLLPVVLDENRKKMDIGSYLRPAQFVPLSIRSDELLQRFRASRSHLSIVVDEYESVVGVVTIEDVLEEIVGDITDETDEVREIEFVSISENVTEVVGNAHIQDINEHLKIDLPVRDAFDTLAGLVLTKFGRIPKLGDSMIEGNVKIEVLEVSKRRIEKLLLEVLEDHHLD